MNYTLTINLEGAEKTDAALNSLIKKVGSIASGDLSNIQMDKLIDDSGILKAGELGAEKFTKGFSGKMRGYNATFKELWKPLLPSADFINDPGFFTRGKIKAPPIIPQNQSSGVDSKALMVGAMATLFNPFVGARMLSNAFPSRGGVGNGLFGAAGAMGYGEIFVSIKILSTLFNGLKKAVQETLDTYQKANHLYAKTLMSGMGSSFTTRRSMISEIMGVSEQDVFKFGAQMAYLNPKLEFATNIISRTTPNLASASWELKILTKDFEALTFHIVSDATPAIKGIIIGLQELTKAADEFYNRSKGAVGKIAEVASYQLLGVVKTELLRGLLGLSYQVGSAHNLPPAFSTMKQMPVSHWERMGLVTSGGNTQNWAMETAKNTRELVIETKKKNGTFGRIGGKGWQGQSWGLSPTVANP